MISRLLRSPRSHGRRRPPTVSGLETRMCRTHSISILNSLATIKTPSRLRDRCSATRRERTSREVLLLVRNDAPWESALELRSSGGCCYGRVMHASRHLSDEEFTACFGQPMRSVTEDAEPVVDIWPYVDGLDVDALGLPGLNDVHHVYRDAGERFDHVLIGTGRFNTLLVVVVDRQLGAVLGHRLLDLNQTYGHTPPDDL